MTLPGTTLFDGVQARKGYALNKMCFSFNDAANRAAFLADEDAYCSKYGLNAQQREAIRRRNVLDLIAAGGNVYYLAKFAGIFGPAIFAVVASLTGSGRGAIISVIGFFVVGGVLLAFVNVPEGQRLARDASTE